MRHKESGIMANGMLQLTSERGLINLHDIKKQNTSHLSVCSAFPFRKAAALNRYYTSHRPSQLAAAAPRCDVQADSRCMLVSAAGTRVQTACHREHAPTGA